jgi:cation diffusion facilitator family transporter
MVSIFLDKKLKNAAILTIFFAILLFLIKFQAYRMTGSQAIFSESMESIVNVFASVIAFCVVAYSAKPADKDHPYGHGKVEYLSAALEGGLIAFAAFLIIVEAVQAFYEKRSLNSLNIGILLLAITGVINLVLGFYLLRIGKTKQSVALESSGRHLLADFWTTVGVLLGLALVEVTQIFWIDILIAILVSLHLINEGYKLIRKAISGLLDEEQEDVIKQIQSLVNNHSQQGIIQVHHLRVMRSGNYHHIDAHVVVPEFWTVEEAHDNTNIYERTIFKNYEFTGEIHFHIDPCRRLYCQFCILENCPVRREAFQGLRPMSISELTNKDEPKDILKKIKKK